MSKLLGRSFSTEASFSNIAFCIRLKGVAPVVASIYVMLPAAGHVVICTGKLINKNTRPASAGLKIFCPRPPKVILPTPMANKAPSMIIQMGKLLGRLKPKSKPVRIAEPSRMVKRSRFRINLVMAHSKNTQDNTEAVITATAPQPKNQKLASKAGNRAIHTPYMFFCTESPPYTCGERDITSLFIVVHYLAERALIIPITVDLPKRM